MGEPLRIACVGGGGGVVPSIAHGLAQAMGGAEAPAFAAELALVQPDAARAERSAAYTALLARSRSLPLTAAPRSLEQALDGADLVLCCQGRALDPARARLEAIYGRIGWRCTNDGPGAVAGAVAAGRALMALARAAAARCPSAPLVSLTHPVDVLVGAARRRFGHAGLRPVGLCPEVEALRGVLAFAFGVPEDDITLVHGGVDHVGWVARFVVAGRDGYAELGPELAALARRPDMRPENRVISEIYALTGLIRASARHAWPFVLSGDPPNPRPVPAPGERRRYREALVSALETGRPIPEPAGGHPAEGLLREAGAGRALGRMVRALATGLPAVVALQLPYAGEALGWSPEITVELPAVVGRDGADPVPVGPLPPGVDGLPRMLGQQRALAADYVAGPDEAVLRRALAATPQWGSAAEIRALAGALHAEFARELDAAMGG